VITVYDINGVEINGQRQFKSKAEQRPGRKKKKKEWMLSKKAQS
jgi:hypothetical protein